MRLTLKKSHFTLLTLLLLSFAGKLNSQSVSEDFSKWNVYFGAGTAQYDGDYGSEIFKFNRKQSTLFSFGVSKILIPILSVDLGLNFTKLDYTYIVNRDAIERLPPDNSRSFRTRISTFSSSLKLTDENKKLFPILPVKPFIESGFFIGKSNSQFNEPQFQSGMLAGVGFTAKISSSVSADIGLRYNWFLFNNNAQDAIEGIGPEFVLDKADQDEFLATTINLRKRFASKKLQTKELDLQNAVDTDLDGVTDDFDKCPTVSGDIATFGCPDNDKDGIQNSLDLCPDVAGTSSANGCPDSDLDGVTDLFDDCPTRTGNTLTGCLDTDYDGVIDSLDLCPTSFGLPTLNGCNTLMIYFDVDQSDLNKLDTLRLTSIVSDLQAYDNDVEQPIVLFIEGHTDATGSYSYNDKLAENRALEVSCLVQDISSKIGLQISIETSFYGERKPLNENKTVSERAKNRRVELRINLVKNEY